MTEQAKEIREAIEKGLGIKFNNLKDEYVNEVQEIAEIQKEKSNMKGIEERLDKIEKRLDRMEEKMSDMAEDIKSIELYNDAVVSTLISHKYEIRRLNRKIAK